MPSLYSIPILDCTEEALFELVLCNWLHIPILLHQFILGKKGKFESCSSFIIFSFFNKTDILTEKCIRKPDYVLFMLLRKFECKNWNGCHLIYVPLLSNAVRSSLFILISYLKLSHEVQTLLSIFLSLQDLDSAAHRADPCFRPYEGHNAFREKYFSGLNKKTGKQDNKTTVNGEPMIWPKVKIRTVFYGV